MSERDDTPDVNVTVSVGAGGRDWRLVPRRCQSRQLWVQQVRGVAVTMVAIVHDDTDTAYVVDLDRDEVVALRKALRQMMMAPVELQRAPVAPGTRATLYLRSRLHPPTGAATLRNIAAYQEGDALAVVVSTEDGERATTALTPDEARTLAAGLTALADAADRHPRPPSNGRAAWRPTAAQAGATREAMRVLGMAQPAEITSDHVAILDRYGQVQCSGRSKNGARCNHLITGPEGVRCHVHRD
jgi:hypothetical protein